jgi:hypothetical protein
MCLLNRAYMWAIGLAIWHVRVSVGVPAATKNIQQDESWNPPWHSLPAIPYLLRVYLLFGEAVMPPPPSASSSRCYSSWWVLDYEYIRPMRLGPWGPCMATYIATLLGLAQINRITFPNNELLLRQCVPFPSSIPHSAASLLVCLLVVLPLCYSCWLCTLRCCLGQGYGVLDSAEINSHN